MRRFIFHFGRIDILAAKFLNMKQKLSFILLLLSAVGAFAQQPFGNLTIFSEDGDKFFLILNGEKINDVAQANLRVEELTQPYYNAKIIFEDQAKQPISKNNLMIADVDGIFKDVTYKIKRDRNNAAKMKLNYFSMADVDRGYLPASNVTVVHYGQPAPPMPSGSVTQTTTTTTTGGVQAGINMGGVGVNVSINDPNMVVTHAQTTTTTTTSSGHHGQHNDGPRGCANNYCMSASDFHSALQTLNEISFDETRLKTAKQIAASNCLNATQISDICRTFSFDESKLDFAKSAYSHCTEPSNYFKVNNVFEFSSNVDELNEFVASH